MILKNSKYNKLTERDMLVFTVGHEPRSTYLFEQNYDSRDQYNTLAFHINNKSDGRSQYINKLKKQGITVIDCDYGDVRIVADRIIEFVNSRESESALGHLNIDYSSMPRSWYCALPILFDAYYDYQGEVFFWYNAGTYPRAYKDFPTEGIDSISVFSGISLPSVDTKRYHFMGLGFDSLRTETIKSIVEPDTLIACYAYNPKYPIIKDQVYNVNKRTIQNASLSVTLPLDSFVGMVDKLCSLVYDLLQKNAQVVLVPDGPKPLIMPCLLFLI